MTLLTVIVPIRGMSGRLSSLFDWTKDLLDLGCQAILVHDYLDQETEDELIQFVKGNESENLVFLSSRFNSPGLARNAGLYHAIGDYITFWDSDDFPNVRETLKFASVCRENKIEIGIGGFSTVNENNDEIFNFPAKIQSNFVKISMYPGIWRMLFRSSILTNKFFTELLLAEDQLFLASLRPLDKKILFSDSIHYNYVVHGSGALTTLHNNSPDLKKAIFQFEKLFNDSKSQPEREFDLALIIKNCVTMIRIGSNKEILFAIWKLLNFWTKHPILTNRILTSFFHFKISKADIHA